MLLGTRAALERPSDLEGRMIAKQKEKWMEYCELAAKEQDPKKLIALIAEISRLLAQRADAMREESATSHH